jgi:mevalonate pyrophosphate decarboxylase
VIGDANNLTTMNGTSLTLTIPANSSVAFAVGTMVTVENINASSLSIAITTDTLILAGTTTTGTRTLAQNGVATLLKTASTTWKVLGAGVT